MRRRPALIGLLVLGAALPAPATAAGATGPSRLVAKPDGFLTARSDDAPREVALDYVRRRPGAFGVEPADVDGLELTRRYTWGPGVTHLQWAQTVAGLPLFGAGLVANVAEDGRLVNVGGRLRSDVEAGSPEPRLGAREALLAVAREASARVELGPGETSRGGERLTSFEAGHRASLVIFAGDGRSRVAWRVLLLVDGQRVYDAVVDAASGEVLSRRNLVWHATGLAFDTYPGAPVGGTQATRDFTPWLSASTRLFGPNAHVHVDPNNSYYQTTAGPLPAAGDEIPPLPGGNWNYTQRIEPTVGGGVCPPAPTGCTWDDGSASFSWTENENQAGTQLFYYVNRFHDHLLAEPIGFGAPSGNFEGADRVLAQVDDGAAIGGPARCDNRNNASMSVLPDGLPGLMEMFLFTSSCPFSSGIYDVNGADDAYIVYHEYTHGLSFRLITDPSGVGALETSTASQSGSMAEGWSDWYAADYLVGAGLEADNETPGQLLLGKYENARVRTEALDCPLGSSAPACPGSPGAGPGGYTYGDFGKVLGVPEIHADGEIWAQTLWDLRGALVAAHGLAGVTRARALVTDGMRLSPDYPTFLNMRDAILQSDVLRGFKDRDLIWGVFARRGMGLNASTFGDTDTAPIEDFTAPPTEPDPPDPQPDTTAPVASRFSMSRKRFRVGRASTARAAQLPRRRRPAPKGSRFRFHLSEPATVYIVLERALPGRKVGRSCRRPSRRLRGRARCTRYVRKGRLIRANRKAGSNRVAFSGRLGRSPLRAGRYRATMSAVDAAKNRSRKSVRTSFTIVRR